MTLATKGRPRKDAPPVSPAETRRRKARREYQNAWRARNRKRYMKQQHKWRADNEEHYRAKSRASVRSWNARHPGYWREYRYGVTPEQIEAMHASQRGCCAVCVEPFHEGRFHVDHDHSTGKVRGLLCSNCNRGLGCFRDRPDYLEAGAAYIRRTTE